MDTSEIYVSMCRKATEVQAMKEFFEDGDYYSYPEKKTIGISIYSSCAYSEGYIDYKRNEGSSTWLPKQDQLQEIVWNVVQVKPGTCRTPLMKLFAEFLEFAGDSGANYDSFEQLWLAFVMKEKYGLVWDKNDWIKEQK